jgi:hypothetical protein
METNGLALAGIMWAEPWRSQARPHLVNPQPTGSSTTGMIPATLYAPPRRTRPHGPTPKARRLPLRVEEGESIAHGAMEELPAGGGHEEEVGELRDHLRRRRVKGRHDHAPLVRQVSQRRNNRLGHHAATAQGQ